MTSNRRRKAEIRTYQAATGVPYMEARRQTTLPTLAEVMEQHRCSTTSASAPSTRGARPRSSAARRSPPTAWSLPPTRTG